MKILVPRHVHRLAVVIPTDRTIFSLLSQRVHNHQYIFSKCEFLKQADWLNKRVTYLTQEVTQFYKPTAPIQVTHILIYILNIARALRIVILN